MPLFCRRTSTGIVGCASAVRRTHRPIRSGLYADENLSGRHTDDEHQYRTLVVRTVGVLVPTFQDLTRPQTNNKRLRLLTLISKQFPSHPNTKQLQQQTTAPNNGNNKNSQTKNR